MILPDEFAAVVLGNDTKFQTSDILDAALTALYPSEVAAQSGIVAAALDAVTRGEDKHLTKRFSQFLERVLAGHLDIDGVCDRITKALTPDVIDRVRDCLIGDGALGTLQLLSVDHTGSYTRYHYKVIPKTKTAQVIFVLDEQRCICGFFAL